MATNDSRPRIEAVIFDAMNTIFEIRGSYRELLATVYRRHLDRDVDDERLHEIYQRTRIAAGPVTDFSRYWAGIHRSIIAAVKKIPLRRVALREGRAIHMMVMSDASLYRVSRETRSALAFASRHFRLVIASNQEREHLMRMLATFGIAELFEGVFCSSELGASKPSPEFFERVLTQLGVTSAQACYVGNSIRNDLPARLVGCRLILIDRADELTVSLPHTAVIHSNRELRKELERLAAENA